MGPSKAKCPSNKGGETINFCPLAGLALWTFWADSR